MANGSDERRIGVQQRAEACAARLRSGAGGVDAAATEWSALLEAVRAMDARFAFETEGRGSAIETVRHALPAIERDLLDAIVEDHACEVAALREAVNQLMTALARR